MQRYQIAIIGGGPAGCQCALWLAMLGYHPLLLEKHAMLGGLLNINPFINNWLVGIPNQTGMEYASAIHHHIQASANIDIQLNADVKSITYLPETGYTIHANNRSIIQSQYLVLATGVLPNKGEFSPSKNILIGPGRHISEYDFQDKKVAIFGGGDNAAENYQYIHARGADQIHIYARNLKARRQMLEPIPETHIHVGKYQVDCDAMTVKYNEVLQRYDVFLVFYGWQANIPNGIIDLIKKDEQDVFIVTNQHRESSVPNFYAIGEVTQATHPCIATAFADGVIAAKAIQNRIELNNKLND